MSNSPLMPSNKVWKDGESSVEDHLHSTSRICLALQWEKITTVGLRNGTLRRASLPPDPLGASFAVANSHSIKIR